VAVADDAALMERVPAAGHPVILPPEERWYRAGRHEIGQRPFVVADPDGYLLRPCQRLGMRRAA
jgi:hypothetical protein